MERASCRTGAAIIWAVTAAGKRIPLDAESEARFVLDDPLPGPTPAVHVVATYQTHFATCPHAAAHRRRP
jgi:hypothetical protein